VKLFQERLCRSSFRHTENDACCRVLDALQFLDAAGRGSMQHSITVHDETCSTSAPQGNVFDMQAFIKQARQALEEIVQQAGLMSLLSRHLNSVILQTFTKFDHQR